MAVPLVCEEVLLLSFSEFNLQGHHTRSVNKRISIRDNFACFNAVTVFILPANLPCIRSDVRIIQSSNLLSPFHVRTAYWAIVRIACNAFNSIRLRYSGWSGFNELSKSIFSIQC